ncbi:TetR/AcrR family transcriptional regulator [Lawsonibacter sp. LCP25S3_G6]|uniref:TetR/AcrR family transcriptional regulator n=1 Tax=unclassified Lawsonibacter TaxID=2617946 RepID=UPI003F9AF178
MPTSTYFRLPQEKRERLMTACWSEITRVRFADMSVNRIISQAHIPRGSFYQYFADKEDMIRYLLNDMQEYFVQLLRGVLTDSDGDLFAIPVSAFEQFMDQGNTNPMLRQFIRVLQLNPGWDTQAFMTAQPGLLPDSLWELVNPAVMKKPDREYAEHVFHLLCAVLAYAVVGTLQDPEGWKRQCEILKTRVAMIKYGCAAGNGERNKEETAP